MKIQKILFPTDFSQVAKGAFIYTLHLAEKMGASVTVLHVYRADFGVPVPEVMAYDMLEARKRHASNQMEAFIKATNSVEEALYGKVKVTTQIEMGLAVDAILDVATEGQYDLVAMGTKGEHNMAEVIFGSITSSVMNAVNLPLIAVPEGAVFQDLSKIAYAVDLSDASLETASVVADWAKVLGAQLQCVHINTNKLNDHIQASAWEELIQNKGVTVHELESESVNEGLNTFVQTEKSSMLILLHHRRSWFESLFHTSQSKKMALRAAIPLFILQD